jgi:hypothetical protein
MKLTFTGFTCLLTDLPTYLPTYLPSAYYYTNVCRIHYFQFPYYLLVYPSPRLSQCVFLEFFFVAKVGYHS